MKFHMPARMVCIGGVLLLVLASGIAYYANRYWLGNTSPLPRPDLSGVPQEAADAVEEACDEVRQSPSSPQLWGQSGMMLMAHGFPHDARHCFREAARLEPQQFLWVYLPSHILEETDLGAALSGYQRAVVLEPNYGPLRYRLAMALMRLNRPDEAEHQFRRAAELIPNSPEPHMGMGRVSLSRGDNQTAREYFETAARLFPLCRQAHVELARVCHVLGDVETARREQQQAAQLPETPPGVPDPLLYEVQGMGLLFKQLAQRGDALVAEGNLAGAAEAFRAAIQTRPDLYRAHLNLGRVLERQGNLQEALRIYRELADRFPTKAPVHYSLALLLERLADSDGAIECCRKCIAIKPDFAQAHFSLGRLLEKRGNLDEAADALRCAVDIDPQLAPAHLALGLLLQGKHDFGPAIYHLECAVKLAPGDPIPQEHLDRARRQQSSLQEERER